MIKFTLFADGNPIWIAAWQVVQVFPNPEGGTTIHQVGQIQTHVRERTDEIAVMVELRRPR